MNAMNNDLRFINEDQSILEVEDEEAEPDDHSRSTQSKSSKSMVTGGVKKSYTVQENLYRAVDASYHVIQSSTAQDSSRTSPKKAVKNYNNITPILRASPGANRPATT